MRIYCILMEFKALSLQEGRRYALYEDAANQEFVYLPVRTRLQEPPQSLDRWFGNKKRLV